MACVGGRCVCFCPTGFDGYSSLRAPMGPVDKVRHKQMWKLFYAQIVPLMCTSITFGQICVL